MDLKLYGKAASCGKHKYKIAVWCWYIVMAYLADFNFGM